MKQTDEVKTERITSRSNPLIARVRRLSDSAAYRREMHECVCDGVKLLNEALQWGADIQTIICTDSMILPDFPSKIRVVRVPEDVMKSAAPSRTPQGVLCVCGLPEPSFPETLSGRRYLVLEGVQDPGNVGTVLRTADAFGADGVFLLPGCADLWSPKTLRASMGAVFRLPAWTCGTDALKNLLIRSRIPLYGAAVRSDTTDVRTTDLSRFAAAVGSEGRGLSATLLNLCDGTVHIPMRERCESLNAAMAAGVILWEAARQEPF